MARLWAIDSALPTQSSTTSAPPDSVTVSPGSPPKDSECELRRTARGNWHWWKCLGGAEGPGQALLVGVLGSDQYHPRSRASTGRGQVGQGGDDGEAQGAGAQHGHHVVVADAGAQNGMDGAGHGLDRDGIGIAEPFGHGEELTGVGHQAAGGPTAAGVGAVAGLQAGPDMTEGHPLAVADAAGRAGGAGRFDAAGRAPEHGLEDDPGAGRQGPTVGGHAGIGEQPHHLVPRHKGKGHDVLEITRATAIERRQVRAADARQQRIDVDPPVAGQRGCFVVQQSEGPDTGTAPGAETRSDPGGGEAGE